MILTTGTQDRLISEETTGAGSTTKEISIQSDAILVTLWAESVTSGTLNVSVYTLTDTGKEKLLFSFPELSASTTSLLLKKSSISMQRIRLSVTYTGIVNYEIYCRAISTIGEASMKIVGSSNLISEQKTIGVTPVELISSTLSDRYGLVIKNWAGGGDLYIAESSAKLTAGKGYPLALRDGLALDISAGSSIWAVSGSGDIDVRILEAGEI